MSAKVCVFGADSMEPKLILDWAASGHLPNLARMRAQGAWGYVINPPRFFSGASWPNFYTGVGVGRHHQYLHTTYDRKTLAHAPFRPNDATDAFWLRGGWSSRKTAVLTVPYCPPDARIRGRQVVDWDAHDFDHKGIGSVAIPEDGPVSRFSRGTPVNCYKTQPTAAHFRKLRDGLLQRTQLKADLTCELLSSEEWDLLISIVDEPHCAGHQLWHLHDSSHPRHVPELAGTLGHALRDIYVGVDAALGRVASLLAPDSNLLFLSSHGIGPAHDANSVFDEILRRIEGLPPHDPDFADTVPVALQPLRKVWMQLPQELRTALEPIRRRLGRKRIDDALANERLTRKCFWFPTHDLWGGIRINLAGREIPGRVQPGAEYERFVDELTSDLHALRDGRSGEPIVEDVVRSRDIDLADFDGEFPDLIVRWKKAALSWIESPKVGRIDPTVVMGRTGDHASVMRGVFFAVGPGVKPGKVSDVRLEDFAPTLSAMLGVALEDSDGAVIPAAVARTEAA